MKKLARLFRGVKASTFEHKHLTKKYFGNIDFYNYACISIEVQKSTENQGLQVDFVPYNDLLPNEIKMLDACKNQVERNQVYNSLPKDSLAVQFHEAIKFGLQYAFTLYLSETGNEHGIEVKVVDITRNLVTDDEIMAYVSAQALWKALKFTPSSALNFDPTNEVFDFLPEYMPSEPDWRILFSNYQSIHKFEAKISLQVAREIIWNIVKDRYGVYEDHIYLSHENLGFGWLFTSNLFFDETLFLESLMGTFYKDNFFDILPGQSVQEYIHIVFDKYTEYPFGQLHIANPL